MRVHRTMCSGHRPRSNPRPMVAPVARHRPGPGAPRNEPRGPRAAPRPHALCEGPRRPERAGQRCGPDVAGDPRSSEAGRRPPAAEESCAGGGWGSVPRASVCARGGCRRSVRASDSLINFTRARGGKTGNSSPTAGQDLSPPESFAAPALSSLQPSPTSCRQSRPRDLPLRGLCKLSAAPPTHPTSQVPAPSSNSEVTKRTFRKAS